ncbi:MAG: ribonuclease III [Rickettsiales bacterium]|jgi:ribonuclease-3|nr:ribonuclease III [Rickettsiales bacterium]
MNHILGYNFINPIFLKHALTHPSLCAHNKSNLTSYERLEFLGDSALSLVISEFLINKFPEEDEGSLAKRRSYLVSGEILTQIALKLNLGKMIIMTYAEDKSGGRRNSHNLENVLEAILGAIYLDGGLDSVKPIIFNLWHDILDKMVEVPIDPKSKLQEELQKLGLPLPKYELISSTGPEHKLTFRVKLKIPGFKECIGKGNSKKQAEKEAASLLLLQMEKQACKKQPL